MLLRLQFALFEELQLAGLVAKDLFVVLDQVAEDFDENAAPVEQHRRRIHRKESRKETGGDVARVHLVHARVKRHPEKKLHTARQE